MKKLLLALTLLAPMINAESIDAQISDSQAEITPEMIQFAAKLKTLHAFCIEEYTVVQELFKECASIYGQTFELLFALEQKEDEVIKELSRTLQDELTPAVMDLNELLHRLQELNTQMAQFNVLIQETEDHQEIIKNLLAIAQETHIIRVSLEAIKQYENQIYTQALELSAQN